MGLSGKKKCGIIKVKLILTHTKKGGRVIGQVDFKIEVKLAKER